jgi:hypothetical protein
VNPQVCPNSRRRSECSIFVQTTAVNGRRLRSYGDVGHKASRSEENANVKGRSVPAIRRRRCPLGAPIHNRQRKKGAARTSPPLDASGVTEREHCRRQRQSARAQGPVSLPHVWMAPTLQELFSSAALVACGHVSGLSVRSHITAGLDGFRESRPGLDSRSGGQASSRSVGSTDCAITCFSLSQARGTWHAHMLVLLRVGRGPVYS